MYVVQPAGMGALVCLSWLLVMDPGSTTRWRAQNPHAFATPCRVCQLPRPSDTHHCRTCDQCVVEHDHHCSVLGVCIAGHNRRCFIALLALGAFSYTSMCAASVSTWSRQLAAPSSDAYELWHRYALPSTLLFLGALVLGTFAAVQIVCLWLGLRFKTHGLIRAIAAELFISRKAALSTGSEERSAVSVATTEGAGGERAQSNIVDVVDEEELDDDMEPPGCVAVPCLARRGSCCSCVTSQHRRGLGAILPGASLIHQALGGSADAQVRTGLSVATFVQTGIALAALAEWAGAALLLGWYGGLPVAMSGGLLVLSACVSCWAMHELKAFQDARATPNARDGAYFPRSAALSPQPTVLPDGTLLDGTDGSMLDGAHAAAELDEPTDVHANDLASSKQRLVGAQIIEWCSHCQLYVRRPSAHCNDCGRCIVFLDHHCTLLHVCVGLDNRVNFLRIVGLGLFIMLCHLVAVAAAAPTACVAVPPVASQMANATMHARSVGAAIESLTALAMVHSAGLVPCLPVAVCGYAYGFALVWMVIFLGQQLIFVTIIEGPPEGEVKWRRWILVNVFGNLKLWAKQREQYLRGGL